MCSVLLAVPIWYHLLSKAASQTMLYHPVTTNGIGAGGVPGLFYLQALMS